jgi:hypothetical protein
MTFDVRASNLKSESGGLSSHRADAGLVAVAVA